MRFGGKIQKNCAFVLNKILRHIYGFDISISMVFEYKKLYFFCRWCQWETESGKKISGLHQLTNSSRLLDDRGISSRRIQGLDKLAQERCEFSFKLLMILTFLIFEEKKPHTQIN